MDSLLEAAISRRGGPSDSARCHAAIFFCNGRILSYGENRPRGRPPFPTVHAECDAMNKLPPRSTRGRRTRLDLLVIRVNRGGSIGNSRPCAHCVQALRDLPRRGYVLDTVHYSDQNTIKTEKFSEILEGPQHYGAFFSRA
jgi:hypothetical protein